VAVAGQKQSCNTVTFVDRVIEEMPFPLQRIETDRGTPADRVCELSQMTPLNEEVALAYDADKERERISNWSIDRALSALTGQRKSGDSAATRWTSRAGAVKVKRCP
jgi:hypothetical protein